MAVYVGEIRMFAGNYEPAGWKFCEGQLLPISEYNDLFNLIRTTYGGDGESTFAVPDLRGRSPLHQGANHGRGFNLGDRGGVEEVTLTSNQIPAHNHVPLGTTGAGTTAQPDHGVWAAWSDNPYGGPAPHSELVSMSPHAITPTGGGQPHENMPPYLALNFIISMHGLFPSET